MSVNGRVIEKMYAGDMDPLRHCMRQVGDATSPNGVVTATQGTHLIIDYFGNAADSDVYINTDGASAWTLIHDETAGGD